MLHTPEERIPQIFCDLGRLCEPACHISPIREVSRWNCVPYETAEIQGTMLVSVYDGHPQNVTLPLELSGWYRIYVGLGAYGSAGDISDIINLKLTDDHAFMHLSPSGQAGYAYHSIQECFWRCADLTGQSLEIGKHAEGQPCEAILAWVRVVPMSVQEVVSWKEDLARKDTKRIYATNDMHGMLALYGLKKKEEWRSVVQEYIDSDVEWLSLENILCFDGEPSTGNPASFAFCRPGDHAVQRLLKQYFTMEMLSDLAAYGHQKGIKICLSLRMGAWGIEFPYDQMYFDNTFALEHPNLRCVDRDGSPIDALSYMYPEVQDYMIHQFVDMAATGCEAVEMIFSRGVPYVLFEPPFIRLFQERFGEDPRYLPLDDPRVTDLRCEILTGFVRLLRTSLDAARPHQPVGLHARVQFCLYDCRHVGVDPTVWAREGLITAVISYPQRIREVLPANLWQQDQPGHLDLEAYENYVRTSEQSTICRQQDFCFLPPVEDSQGILQGPADQQERVSEFMRLEQEYGVTVYLEILPRFMSPDAYRERALELYRCGCGHISLWDTYMRAPRKAEWSMLRRLGHRDELPFYSSGEGELYRQVRLLKIGNKDVSRYKPAWGG
ncbi:MAG: hypothetical protein HFI33_01155 [Lachnospiraceae bacterium]|nr:hypothetical protein [Lachnospiraceae bacterium]